jgi:hypothetical protein
MSLSLLLKKTAPHLALRRTMSAAASAAVASAPKTQSLTEPLPVAGHAPAFVAPAPALDATLTTLANVRESEREREKSKFFVSFFLFFSRFLASGGARTRRIGVASECVG